MCPSVLDECQYRIKGLAKEPINIVNLLSKEGAQQIVFTPWLHFAAPVFPPLLPGELYLFVGSQLLYYILTISLFLFLSYASQG